MDNLAKDMIKCKKDGFGVHYGKWKAMQPPVKISKKKELPKGWKECPVCGKYFKPNNWQQRFCEVGCRDKNYESRRRELNLAYAMRDKERKALNEANA